MFVFRAAISSQELIKQAVVLVIFVFQRSLHMALTRLRGANMHKVCLEQDLHQLSWVIVEVHKRLNIQLGEHIINRSLLPFLALKPTAFSCSRFCKTHLRQNQASNNKNCLRYNEILFTVRRYSHYCQPKHIFNRVSTFVLFFDICSFFPYL